jgi:hypothetical protein
MKLEVMAVAVVDTEGQARDMGFVTRGNTSLRWYPLEESASGVFGDLPATFEEAEESGNVARLWEYMKERGLGYGTSLGEPFSVEADKLDDAIQLILARMAAGVQHDDGG